MNLSLGVFLTALTTLLLELTLIRVFDVLWFPTMAYMIITLAMFSFGMSGVLLSVFRYFEKPGFEKRVALLCALLALSAASIYPILEYVKFDHTRLAEEFWSTIGNFLIIYIAISIPFLLGGLVLSIVFSKYAEKINRLYFWDLLGAALACIAIIPIIPRIGAFGLLFVVSGIAFVASGVFATSRLWKWGGLLAGILVAATPFLGDGYLEVSPHTNKRNVKLYKEQGMQPLTRWDPISKIEVFQYSHYYAWIAYDGGSQNSSFHRFDGDFDRVRNRLPAARSKMEKYFSPSRVIASHYLKRETGHSVLVIGSAGGQEMRAALTFGASRIDAVELVGTVIDLGKNEFADYTGQIFNNPRVNVKTGEGRAFLRSTNMAYDVIQIFSNHASSTITSGGSAMDTTYLQTADAYKEYFSHLTGDGILQINHHFYPRMVMTAALAWKEMGRTDFQNHVVVFQTPKGRDTLATFLVKMTPWTNQEIKELDTILGHSNLVVDPLNSDESFLSQDFFTGDLTGRLAEIIPYRIYPTTDNRPYFNFIRKSFGTISSDPSLFVNDTIENILNTQSKSLIPMDVAHLVIPGTIGLMFALLFLLVPKLFSKAGKESVINPLNYLIYFACLGSGFIIYELVFVQNFMKLIGFPLYTYSTVMFAFLLWAGIGSFLSGKYRIWERGNWFLPFFGIAAYTVVYIAFSDSLFNLFLMQPVLVRVLASVLIIAPLAICLGMPFPAGVQLIRNLDRSAVAWVWGINGLFTIIGGVSSVVLSIYFGFRFTLLLGTAIYILAFIMHWRMRTLLSELNTASHDVKSPAIDDASRFLKNKRK